MLQSRSGLNRSLSIVIAILFMLVSVLSCTESVSAASKLKVKASKKTVYIGQTVKLKANKNVKWSVSKRKVAKLMKIKKKTVTVKGLKAGTTYVTAKAGKKTKKIKIVVKSKAPKKIKLSASNEVIGLGEYCTVFVDSVKPAGTSKKVSFSSGNKKIAIINDKGLVTGLSEGVVTITARSKVDKKVKGHIRIKVVPARAGKITLNVDLSDESRYPAGKKAKVWLPVPNNDGNQYISAIQYDAPKATNKPEVFSDSGGGKQLYIEWDENVAPADRKASLSYHIYRRAVVRDESLASKEKGTIEQGGPSVMNELNPTMWSGSLTSGIVKETADKIVADKGAKTVYDKAYAIYDWVCDNITRIDDKEVIYGDVVSILSGKRYAGSCMDVNSVFVALCRAEGIPARNLFGMRFAPKYGPNCRAEFYLPGYDGWVPADPALAIKQSWGHESEYIGKNAPNAATWEGIKDKYWGSAEENWICINMGRDILLTPNQSVDTGGEYLDVLNPNGTINLFMFPYGEFDDQYIPCQKANEFKYEYSFEEQDPVDCGC